MSALDERIEALRGRITAAPSADAYGALGAALLERARAEQTQAMSRAQDATAAAHALYREALQHARSAARLAPASAQARRLAGTALREIGELEASHAEFAEAYRLAAHDAAVAADYAASLQALPGAQDAASRARAIYEAALARHPHDAALHAGLALTLLGEGDFARGWDEYEWRLKLPGARSFPFPAWQGEPLAGRTLLVHSEQGLGDEVMFASCFAEVIEQSKHCVLEVSTRLVPLFRRSFPSATILTRSLSKPHDWSQLPAIDLQVAAGSVPRFLRRSRAAFPAHAGYLQADAGRIGRWRTALEALGAGLKVGLAWTGGLPGTLRAARSLAAADLAPLLAVRGARFVALEFLDARRELAALPEGSRPTWWPEATRDPDELAALLCALDLVISVTTTSAHLAGALGRPLWILVPSVPTWRYLWRGDTLPWYPSATLWRRQGESVDRFARVLAEALKALL